LAFQPCKHHALLRGMCLFNVEAHWTTCYRGLSLTPNRHVFRFIRLYF
jgi:hypothetical protein